MLFSVIILSLVDYACVEAVIEFSPENTVVYFFS